MTVNLEEMTIVLSDGETYQLVKPEHYKSLVEDRDWLYALESAGVDNWQGIDHAYEILEEIKDERD